MGVSLTIFLVITGVLTATAVGVLVALWVLRRRRDEELLNHSAPSLVMPLSATPHPGNRPHLAHHVSPVRHSPRSVAVMPLEETHDDEEDLYMSDAVHPPRNDAATATSHTPPEPTEVTGDQWHHSQSPTPSSSDVVDDGSRLVDGGSVRYYQQPEDGTLEFLPGRLEVIGGSDQGQEIHFVRPHDVAVPVVTFGRSEGLPHHHVQLLDRTVSRQHARMTYWNDRWTLENVSKTNPVLLNGAALSEGSPPVTLADGDRVEMGAVVFVFHER